jgi:CubicO group peptidase (beta-lactamase class C family)
MSANRMPGWLVLVAAGLFIAAVPAIWISTSPLHLRSGRIPATASAEVPREFAPAVQQARQSALAHLVEHNCPGLSVAVGVGDRLVWAEGFGYADYRTRAPVTPRHRFRIGTASIALTSAAAGLLAEQGRLHFDSEIQSYVPEFPRHPSPVTLRDLMAHTAGLADGAGDEGPLYTCHCRAPAEALPHFTAQPLLFEPGTDFRFSAYGWVAVSAAVEAAAGRPFLEFLEERVFRPLGMSETAAAPGPAEPDDGHPLFNLFRELIFDPRTRGSFGPAAAAPDPAIATSYFPRFAANPRYGMHLLRPVDFSCYAGASVFVSTPSDLVRFAMGLRNGNLLKPATVGQLQTPQRLPSGREIGYGLGWEICAMTLAGQPARCVGHEGTVLGGPTASLLTFPEHGITVAVTANISYANTRLLAGKIADLFAKRTSRR